MGLGLWRTSLTCCSRIFHDILRFATKRRLARLLSTFLCCIVIDIRPFSRLGGSWAFLVLMLKELVFSVQDNLALQLELTILNIMGALAGIGVCTLAKYIASLTGQYSQKARITCAVFLIVISFFAGLIKSRLVRLQLSTRISCFVSVWLLTSNIGVSSHVLSDSGMFLWVTLCPAVICLASIIIVMSALRWSSTSFELELAAAFGSLHQCLSVSLERAFSDAHPVDTGNKINPAEYRDLLDIILQQSIKLNETYSQAAFELRVGRLSLKSIRPLISTIEHVRRELSWGMSFIKPTINFHGPFSQTQMKFITSVEGPALNLGRAILASMKSVEHLIIVAFHEDAMHSSSASKMKWSPSEGGIVRKAEESLLTARDEARDCLRRIFDEIDKEERITGDRIQLPKEIYDCSLAVIALLQMAQEMRQALQVATTIVNVYETSSPRLWYPRISLAWLGVPPGFFLPEDNSHLSGSTENLNGSNADESLSLGETRQGLEEHAHLAKTTGQSLFLVRMKTHPVRVTELKASFSWDMLWNMIRAAWSNDQVLRFRLWLARAHRMISHSSHLRHATKNAVGVALLTFLAFLPEDSTGRKWFISVHGQWMTISYLWVLETNTGATWRTGYLRLVGTIMGAIYGYVTWAICRTNPYGLTVMITVADIPITYWITKTSYSAMAVPASVAIPTIAFAQYVSPDTEPIIKLAILRALMIGAGIILALLMNSLVFPRHCRVLFLSDSSHTLGLLSELYKTLSHDMLRGQLAHAPDDRRRTLKLELQIRNTLYRLSALILTMNNELSLLPKPLHHYRRVVKVLQRALDIMTGLRKIRENIPRKETVATVFKERREFMSCVCISLFACQHAFRAREPLPQFLPSARHAYLNLETNVQECIRKAREEDPHAMGLSLVYAFAEQEVMKNLVDALEELLTLTGRLFGTSAWLPSNSRKTSIHDYEGDHGWYSTFKWEEA